MIGTLRSRLERVVPPPAVGTALAGGGVLSVSVAWLHPEARHIPLTAGVLAILLAGAVVAAYSYPIHVRHQTKVALVSVVDYLRAIRQTLGAQVRHRTNRYLNNRMEPDHRGIKQRSYPMRGFGSFDTAARFCTAHDERRDHVRFRRHLNENETVSLAEQRRLCQERWADVRATCAP